MIIKKYGVYVLPLVLFMAAPAAAFNPNAIRLVGECLMGYSEVEERLIAGLELVAEHNEAYHKLPDLHAEWQRLEAESIDAKKDLNQCRMLARDGQPVRCQNAVDKYEFLTEYARETRDRMYELESEIIAKQTLYIDEYQEFFEKDMVALYNTCDRASRIRLAADREFYGQMCEAHDIANSRFEELMGLPMC